MTDEHDDEIKFLASIPAKANAISVDGESHGGGRLILDVPGTDIAPLLKLTTVRGHALLVTIAPQQTQVFTNDQPPGDGTIPAGDGQSEALFGETPATVTPSGLTRGEASDRQAEEAFNKPRARRVSRGLIPKKRAKR